MHRCSNGVAISRGLYAMSSQLRINGYSCALITLATYLWYNRWHEHVFRLFVLKISVCIRCLWTNLKQKISFCVPLSSMCTYSYLFCTDATIWIELTLPPSFAWGTFLSCVLMLVGMSYLATVIGTSVYFNTWSLKVLSDDKADQLHDQALLDTQVVIVVRDMTQFMHRYLSLDSVLFHLFRCVLSSTLVHGFCYRNSRHRTTGYIEWFALLNVLGHILWNRLHGNFGSDHNSRVFWL